MVLVPGMIEIIAIFEDPNESTESSSILRERCLYIGPTVENPQVPHSPYMYFNHGPWSVQAMSCSVFPPTIACLQNKCYCSVGGFQDAGVASVLFIRSNIASICNYVW